MYAIIRSGGHQYRVSEGDQVTVELLHGDIGDAVTFDVLALDRDGSLRIGTPTVESASVTGRIDEQFRDTKVIAMRYKNKTRQHTRRGHRQQKTRVRITSIEGGE